MIKEGEPKIENLEAGEKKIEKSTEEEIIEKLTEEEIKELLEKEGHLLTTSPEELSEHFLDQKYIELAQAVANDSTELNKKAVSIEIIKGALEREKEHKKRLQKLEEAKKRALKGEKVDWDKLEKELKI